MHFVDPVIMYRVTHDEQFSDVDARLKVKEQLEWIASSDVDAILITCTNMIAILKDEQLSLAIPIIKIDEPYFEIICREHELQTILFTNPATVDGTIERLHQYAVNCEKTINIKVQVIDNTFELIMEGKKEIYNKAISQFLHQIVQGESLISVAQLSMVEAAQQFEQVSGISITNPLQPLVNTVLRHLKME